MIDKKLVHFKNWDTFISESGVNGDYTTPSSGSESDGNAIYGQIKGTSIVFIQDVQRIWTHGNLYTSVTWDSILSDDLGQIKNNIITLDTGELPSGSYTLFYEDSDDQILSNFAEIVTITI